MKKTIRTRIRGRERPIIILGRTRRTQIKQQCEEDEDEEAEENERLSWLLEWWSCEMQRLSLPLESSGRDVPDSHRFGIVRLRNARLPLLLSSWSREKGDSRRFWNREVANCLPYERRHISSSGVKSLRRLLHAISTQPFESKPTQKYDIQSCTCPPNLL